MRAGDRVHAAAVADRARRSQNAVAPVDRSHEVGRMVARIGVGKGRPNQRAAVGLTFRSAGRSRVAARQRGIVNRNSSLGVGHRGALACGNRHNGDRYRVWDRVFIGVSVVGRRDGEYTLGQTDGVAVPVAPVDRHCVGLRIVGK